MNMTIKEQLEKDIKTAMLAGEKTLVTTLRGLKSVILYAEVASGDREAGLPEEQVISLLQKEAKKRQESADLYRTGNNIEKAEHEEAEKKVIDQYLPQQLSEEDVRSLVEEEATKMGTPTLQQMGQLIGAVKQASGGAADGAVIARLVKERLA
jgi:uncharacterized protein YqeY